MDTDVVHLDHEVRVETTHYQRVTLFAKTDILDKLQQAARRDSRPLDHIINVALENYVKMRRVM